MAGLKSYRNTAKLYNKTLMSISLQMQYLNTLIIFAFCSLNPLQFFQLGCLATNTHFQSSPPLGNKQATKSITLLPYDLLASQWVLICHLQAVNSSLFSFVLPKCLTFILSLSFSLDDSSLGCFSRDVLVECRVCITVNFLLLCLASKSPDTCFALLLPFLFCAS